jgi:hypothetical protein
MILDGLKFIKIYLNPYPFFLILLFYYSYFIKKKIYEIFFNNITIYIS